MKKLFTSKSDKQLEELSPPSNLMATLEDQFVVNWTWDALKDVQNGTKCELKYTSDLSDSLRRSGEHFRTSIPHDLSKEMCIKVQLVCMCENVISNESTWAENCTFLLKGNLQPPIKDFECQYYRDEPMECTWHLDKDTPPDTNIILLYRLEGVNKKCQSYTYEEGVVNGCTFVNEINLHHYRINILITDHAMTLGRFYTSLEPVDILKLRPVNITVSKLSSNRIHVEWKDNSSVKDYEVQWKDSRSENWITASVIGQSKYTTDSINPDLKYMVRVRSKFDKYYGGQVWSDWSTESIGEPQDEWTPYYIPLIAIPLVLAIATIVLLVFLKRLRVLIFPPIPDPSKLVNRLFPEHGEESQHWIQRDSAMFLERPMNEEICSVVLVETETSAEMQHG